MKKIFNLAVLFGLLASYLISLSAQQKAVAQEEVIALKDRADAKLKGKTYRVTMTSESFRNVEDAAPFYFINETNEFVASDRERYVSEKRNGKEATVREETITIGQKKYTRLNNNVWTESAASKRGVELVRANIANSGDAVESKYLGKATLKNQQADLYEIKIVRKNDSSNLRFTATITEKIWLDKDGRFLKIEKEFKNNDKVTSRTVWEYKYDSGIKIEPPAMKKDTEKVRAS